MNKKKLMNWLRAGLSIQQVCEIEGCVRKAEYFVSQFRGGSVRVCPDHFEFVGVISEALK